MARVDVTLNGRIYPIACEDGQEPRVLEIAAYLDGLIGEVRKAVRNVTDMHLLVMASLMVADELFDARDRIASLTPPPGEADAVADAVERLAGKVEAIAAKLEQP